MIFDRAFNLMLMPNGREIIQAISALLTRKVLKKLDKQY